MLSYMLMYTQCGEVMSFCSQVTCEYVHHIKNLIKVQVASQSGLLSGGIRRVNSTADIKDTQPLSQITFLYQTPLWTAQ